MDNTDKVVSLIDECAKLGLAVQPPDLNESGYDFTVDRDDAIRYGLGAIRGVGRAAVEVITAERDDGGPFVDLAEFCRRVGAGKVNRRVVEALVKSGAMDSLGDSRAGLVAALPQAIRLAEQHGLQQSTGQEDLFGLGGGGSEEPVLVVPDHAVVEWTEQERLAAEKETLGLYLTGHPIQRYESELAYIVSGRIAELAEEVGEGSGERERWKNQGNAKQVTLAGLIVDIRKRNGRVSLTLDDRSGRVELPLFDEAAQQYRELVSREQLLVVQGRIQFDDFTGGYRVSQKHLYDIAQAREAWGRRLEIDWAGPAGDAGFATALRDALTPYRRGGCPVRVNYRGWSAEVPVDLGAEWRVRPDDALLERLGELATGVRMVYDGGVVEC
jgi:DNA polymerase III subunit alpha